MSPAKVLNIKLDDDKKVAEVTLKPEEVSKAIGRGGHNIRLAGRLTGYEIEVLEMVLKMKMLNYQNFQTK